MPGPARARLGTLLLACGSAVFALALGEAAVRLSGWSPERGTVRRSFRAGERPGQVRGNELDCYPTNPNGDFDVDLRQPAAFERYRDQGFQDLALLQTRAPFCVEFRFNHFGLRGPEYGPRRPGVKRIVVLGDSFTEGQGVRESDSYPAVLAARLEVTAPGRYEVLNFGRRGLDFPEIYDQFESALTLEPDLVIYGLCLNDADRSREFKRSWPELNDWIMVRRPPVRLGPWSPHLVSFVRDRLEARRLAAATTRWYRDLYSDANADGWNRTKDYLDRMNAEMQQRHGRFLVAVWPLLVDLENEYPFEGVHERLARACEHHGIACRDLLPVLKGRNSASLRVHPTDWHPNAAAHRLAAEDLAPRVRQMLD